jgi:hypothetical protein
MKAKIRRVLEALAVTIFILLMTVGLGVAYTLFIFQYIPAPMSQ